MVEVAIVGIGLSGLPCLRSLRFFTTRPSKTNIINMTTARRAIVTATTVSLVDGEVSNFDPGPNVVLTNVVAFLVIFGTNTSPFFAFTPFN